MKLSKIIKNRRKSLNCLIGCHGNHVISHYQNEFIIKEHNVFLLSGPIEPFDINNKCSKDLNVGLITPCEFVIQVYTRVLPYFCKFSLIFMNMQMR